MREVVKAGGKLLKEKQKLLNRGYAVTLRTLREMWSAYGIR